MNGDEPIRKRLEWAPDIPPEWDVVNLKMLARIFAGGTPDRKNTDYWTDGTVPWLNSGSVNDWAIWTPSELVSRTALANGATRWAPKRSVLVALAGQGKTKGMAARLEIDSTLNQSLAAIVPGDSLEYRFLQYWLTSNYLNIRGLAGGDLRDGLNLQHIGSVQVPRPPVEQQRAIADYLDRETAQIDAFIAKNEELITLLTERRGAAAQSEVEQHVGEGSRLKFQFREVDVRAGNKWEALPLLSVSIHHGVVPRDDDSESAGEVSDLSHYKLASSGDIVLNRMRAFQGGLGVAPRTGLVSPDYAVLRPAADVDPDWLALVMRTPRFVGEMVLRLRGIGTTDSGAVRTPRISVADLGEILVSVPASAVQAAELRAVTSFTEQIEAALSVARRSVELARERRAALISAAVTGKIDVGVAV